MKLIDYYLAAFLPILTLITIALALDSSEIFVISLLFYYIYRCILDYYKLKKQGIVSNKDIWKFIVPCHSYLYFKELYFKQ